MSALLICILFVNIQLSAQCPDLNNKPTLDEYRAACQPWASIVQSQPYALGTDVLERGAKVITNNFCRGVR